MNGVLKQPADAHSQQEGQGAGFPPPQLGSSPDTHRPLQPPPPPPSTSRRNNTMILVDIFSMLVRVAELAFAAIVAGLTGNHLRAVRDADSTWQQGRFIYTEVVAGLSIVLAFVWLLVPVASSLACWLVDSVLSVAWVVSFGLLVNWLHGTYGYDFDWDGIGFDRPESCDEWKADLAFAFLSAIVWLVSAILGIYWVYQRECSVSPLVSVPRVTESSERRLAGNRIDPL